MSLVVFGGTKCPRDIACIAATFCLLLAATLGSGRAQEAITIDAHAKATPLPHFWEQMFGSGHANLAMREAWRNDLSAVKSITDMKYVRFHGILDDENGVYTEDEHGNPQYNFTYVNEIYDGMLARGVRPFVEISFMPKQLAAHPAPHAFWYKPNVAPPKDYARWDALIRAFAREPGRALRHRRSLAVVLRSLERAQHRLLGRRAEAVHVLRALQPHCARAEVRQPAAARRRPCVCRRRVGSRVPEIHARQRCAGGLPLHPWLRR